MEIFIALFAVIVAVGFGFYAIKGRENASAVAEENIRIKLENEYKPQIVALQKELQLLRQHSDSQLDEAKNALAEERSGKEMLMQENSNLKAALQTSQSLLEQTKENAKKAETDREEKFRTELNLARQEMRGQFEKEMQERSQILKQEATERMEAMKKTNAEQMENIVGPLQKELEGLRNLVDASHKEQTKHTSTLEASIKAVFEHDQKRDETTRELANALKNHGKVQGDWGEQVLENILRDSGLREGEEYVKQMNVKSENGDNERPDIIVNGADGSRIIIDSKVSLTAYTNYVGADDEAERQQAMRENYDSIWKHVTELAEKNYPKDVDKAMPIVLMFVPNEGSYILAMNKDPQLGAKAFKKNILIINPTNLMVVLKLMFLTWQNTRQEKNNRAILDAAAKIYEKYSTFAEGYVTLGNQLNTARNTYEKGLGQLRDGKANLSKQLQDLLRYGVTASKQIPEAVKSLEE